MTISIVIPTYNRAAWVGQAIRSVLAQTVVDLELIVMDDGSTDDTASVIGALPADGRLRYVLQENSGRSEARNHGLRLAKGEYIGFLDSDDQLLPDALATQLATFAMQPEAGMTVAGYRVVGDQGQALGEFRPWEWADRSDLQGWLFNCFGMPGTVLHRRTWVEHIGGFDRACEIAEDWDLYLRLAAAGCQTAWNRSIVCAYHRHQGSSIMDIERHHSGAERALEKLGKSADRPLDALLLRAQAWNEVVFAKRAADAGLSERAAVGLRRAISWDAALARDERIKVLEFILTPQASAASSDMPQVDLEVLLAQALEATRQELQRAQGHVHMGAFFRSATAQLAPHRLQELLRGLRADPRWLLDRGVLAFLLRHGWPTLRTAAAGFPRRRNKRAGQQK